MRRLRCFTVLASIVAVVALLAQTVGAQAPPLPPHQFYGPAPQVDSDPVADGTVVSVLDTAGMVLGSSSVSGGCWALQISASDAASVHFTVTGADPSANFAVVSGGLTEVTPTLDTLAASPPPTVSPPAVPQPTELPNGGSGGLAGFPGGISLIALAFAGALTVAGLAVLIRSTLRR